MSLKKIFVSLMILGVFVFFASPAKAMTVDELRAKIADLISQIQALQQQLAQQRGAVNPWCYAFNTNLKIGDTGDDVSALQTALKNAGFDIGDDVSGTFGEGTASAVVGLQEKYSSEVLTPVRLAHGNGFVGKLTRGKLNKLFGCNINCAQVITYATNPATQECQQFPTPCNVPSGWASCVPNNISCQNLWWYDNTNKTCQQKQFCGAYMYYGLQTFNTEADCKVSLNATACTTDSDCPQVACDFTSATNSISPSCIMAGPAYKCVSGKCTASQTTKSITVTSPNGGEQWQVGQTYDITWKYTGDASQKVDIFINGPINSNCFFNGAYSSGIPSVVGHDVYCPPSSQQISSGILASTQKYSWTVPSSITPGTQYKIWIGASPAPAVITSPTNQNTVLWNSTGSASATTQISMLTIPNSYSDDSDNYFSIVGSATTDVNCQWCGTSCINRGTGSGITNLYCPQVAALPGTDCKNVNGTCTVVTTGTQTCDQTCRAKGYPSGSCQTFAVSPEGFAQQQAYGQVHTQISDATSDCYVANGILGVTKGCYCDTYTPTKSISVTSPNGGEQLQAGKTYDITWKSAGVSKVNIYITGSALLNGLSMMRECMMVYPGPKCFAGCNSDIIVQNIDASSGKYSWTVPTTQSLFTDAKIYIQEAVSDFMTQTCLSDSSDNNFSIVAPTAQPSITVTSPNGGEQWQIGKTYNITWQSTGIPSNAQMFIQLSYVPINTGARVEAAIFQGNIPNTGVYDWNILENAISNTPWSQIKSDQYLIRVGYTSPTTGQVVVQDYSSNSFSIVSAPFITVVSPNGGEVWRAGEPHDIKWNASGVGKVNVIIKPTDANGNILPGYEYSGFSLVVNSSSPYGPVSDGKWTWPDTYSTYDTYSYPTYNNRINPGYYKIRVENAIDPNSLYDLSDNYFSIVPGATSLNNIQNQLASIANALAQLIEKIKELTQ